jgi:hypothetical protein
MNKERFLELAEQAGFIFWADESWRPKGDTIDWSSNYDEELAKFAELIVRECIDQVLTGPNGPAYYAVEAAMRVKKHFGVEE